MSHHTTMVMPILLSLAHLQSCNARTHELWSATKISDVRISTALEAYETSNITSVYHVGVVCGMRDWCHTFCPDYNGSSHLLSLLSVPGNEDPKGPPWVDCYTDRPRGNFLTAQSGVTVYSAPPPLSIVPQRVVENLLDGVAGIMDDCYASAYAPDPPAHVVFDLGEVRKVRNAIIFSQPNLQGYRYFADLDIRVGMNPADRDFPENGYERLGFYKGPVDSATYEFWTDSPVAIQGRYVSIKSLSKPSLQIYHVEFY